mmetsp:Transcript_29270/g.68075  ORF Transcript_29270/g.68075 Transcript_29270/m.68075 type:complete len:297 (-) Transcript_29270:57-947(-)
MRWTVLLGSQALLAVALHPTGQSELSSQEAVVANNSSPLSLSLSGHDAQLKDEVQAEFEAVIARAARSAVSEQLAVKERVAVSLEKALAHIDNKHDVQTTVQKALAQLESAGLSDSEVAMMLHSALSELGVEAAQKDKVALVLLEMCPLTWYLALDRFYLGSVKTGLAKLAVGLGGCLVGVAIWCCTCRTLSMLTTTVGWFSVLGLVWGLIDFFAVVGNALGQKQGIDSLGMRANFHHTHARAAFALGVTALALLPIYGLLVRGFWWWRKTLRMSRLKANALKSPLFQNKAPIRGG